MASLYGGGDVFVDSLQPVLERRRGVEWMGVSVEPNVLQRLRLVHLDEITRNCRVLRPHSSNLAAQGGQLRLEPRPVWLDWEWIRRKGGRRGRMRLLRIVRLLGGHGARVRGPRRAIPPAQRRTVVRIGIPTCGSHAPARRRGTTWSHWSARVAGWTSE